MRLTPTQHTNLQAYIDQLTDHDKHIIMHTVFRRWYNEETNAQAYDLMIRQLIDAEHYNERTLSRIASNSNNSDFNRRAQLSGKVRALLICSQTALRTRSTPTQRANGFIAIY